MTEQLRIADIARLRGCTTAQIGAWRSQSAPGKRLADHPFPAPDGQDGRSPLWNADRADELTSWSPAPPADRNASAGPGADATPADAPESPAGPDPEAAAREQKRPRRHY